MNIGTNEQLANRYEKRPIIKKLIQLFPYAIESAADVELVTVVEKIREDRAKEFFDELEKDVVQLTPEIIKSEDFLHCYFSTVRAALNSRRREKIRYFSHLLISSITSSKISTTDEYEEYLSILDELSFRELGILVILSRYEKEFFHLDEKNALKRQNRFWPQFSYEVCSRFSISYEELDGILARLSRTGLYKTIVGIYIGYIGGKGELTPLYTKFEKIIRLKECEFK